LLFVVVQPIARAMTATVVSNTLNVFMMNHFLVWFLCHVSIFTNAGLGIGIGVVHDPLAVLRVSAFASVGFEYGGPGFLDLEEEDARRFCDVESCGEVPGFNACLPARRGGVRLRRSLMGYCVRPVTGKVSYLYAFATTFSALS